VPWSAGEGGIVVVERPIGHVGDQRRHREASRGKAVAAARVVVLAQPAAGDSVDETGGDAVRVVAMPSSRSGCSSSHATFIHDGPRQVRQMSKPGLNDGSSIDTEGTPNAAP
jgi:hypothetical protein